MPKFKPRGAFEHSAAGDLWKNTLSRIPTVYGRLAYLASLRDQNSGLYRHHGLAAVFGREESAKALRESHETVFLEWMALPMSLKKQNLMEHFAAVEDPLPVVLDHLLQSRVYRTQVPAKARKMERDLFSSDLDALLEILKNGLAKGA